MIFSNSRSLEEKALFLFLMKYGVRGDGPFSFDGPVVYFGSRPACLPGLSKPYPAPPGQSGSTIPQYVHRLKTKQGQRPYPIPSRSREKVCMPLFLHFFCYIIFLQAFLYFLLFYSLFIKYVFLRLNDFFSFDSCDLI